MKAFSKIIRLFTLFLVAIVFCLNIQLKAQPSSEEEVLKTAEDVVKEIYK